MTQALWQLPADAYDRVIVDGAVCSACYFQREERIFGDHGKITLDAICYFEFPRCGAGCCRVFCGSHIKSTAGRFIADRQGTSDCADRIRWYVKRECDGC